MLLLMSDGLGNKQPVFFEYISYRLHQSVLRNTEFLASAIANRQLMPPNLRVVPTFIVKRT